MKSNLWFTIHVFFFRYIHLLKTRQTAIMLAEVIGSNCAAKIACIYSVDLIIYIRVKMNSYLQNP